VLLDNGIRDANNRRIIPFIFLGAAIDGLQSDHWHQSTIAGGGSGRCCCSNRV